MGITTTRPRDTAITQITIIKKQRILRTYIIQRIFEQLQILHCTTSYNNPSKESQKKTLCIRCRQSASRQNVELVKQSNDAPTIIKSPNVRKELNNGQSTVTHHSKQTEEVQNLVQKQLRFDSTQPTALRYARKAPKVQRIGLQISATSP
ncbi:hypothetical protein KIN20_037528 [Parelaphostrongylus tenuis]|uniref:Uncharacterized protein n=1 Tax=Parelaphostrongylus tenuis TaxID=148309 RepID=A0AAD5WM50_PARTN|nr:hypothetical protein KIN20_037528 [Parelaphostrongylus tenuis]